MNFKNFHFLLLAIFSTCLLFAACGGSGESGPKEPAEPAATFFERERYFSSDQTKDKFYLGYYGSPEKLTDADIHLFVVNPKGDTLFRDKWPANILLTGQAQGITDPSAKSKYISQQLEMIIDDKSLPPAVVIKNPDSDTTGDAKVRRQAEMVFTYKLGQKVKVLSWLEGKSNMLEF